MQKVTLTTTVEAALNAVTTIPHTTTPSATTHPHGFPGQDATGMSIVEAAASWWIGVQATVPPIPHGAVVNGTTIAAIVDSSWIMEPATAIPTVHGNITILISTGGLAPAPDAVQPLIPMAITVRQRSTPHTVQRSISMVRIAPPAAPMSAAPRNPITNSATETGKITAVHSIEEQKAVRPVVTVSTSTLLTV